MVGVQPEQPLRPRVAAVVLAGGSGTRVGAVDNKVYLPVAGRPLIAWALAAIGSAPGLTRLILVVRPGDRGVAEQVIADQISTGRRRPGADLDVDLVEGGATRQDSELAALRRLAPLIGSGEIDVVLIHDGARPLPSARLVAAVARTAWHTGGAVPGLAAKRLVEVDGDGVVRRVLGERAVTVQTPQAFRAAPLFAAYERAAIDGFAGTDTSACLERYSDLAVRVVPGEPDNIKVTVPADLTRADALLRARYGAAEA